MGVLTVAEIVQLICAIIGQSGTFLKIIEDLQAKGVNQHEVLRPDLLPHLNRAFGGSGNVDTMPWMPSTK